MKITKKNKNVALVLDGVSINSLEELKENPSTELLALKNDGKLVCWLRQNEAEDLANAMETLAITGDEAQDLFAVCQLLEMDIDIDDIREAFEELKVDENEKKPSSKKQGKSTKTVAKPAHQVDINNLQMGMWRFTDLPAVNAKKDSIGRISKSTYRGFGGSTALNQIYYYEKWYLISVNTLFYSDDLVNWKIVTENLPCDPKLIEANGDVFVVGYGVVAQILPDGIINIPVPSYYSDNSVTYFNVLYNNGTWFFAGKYYDEEKHLLLEYGKEFDDLVTYSSKQDYPEHNILAITLFENQLIALYESSDYEENIISVSERGKHWADFELDEHNDDGKIRFEGPFVEAYEKLLIAGQTDVLWECIPQDEEMKKVKGKTKVLSSQMSCNRGDATIQTERLYAFNKHGLMCSGSDLVVQ